VFLVSVHSVDYDGYSIGLVSVALLNSRVPIASVPLAEYHGYSLVPS
jgi:hypothetical protein